MDKAKRTNNGLHTTFQNKTRITQETGPNIGAPERSAVPAPLVVSVVLLFYSLYCIYHEHFDGYYYD